MLQGLPELTADQVDVYGNILPETPPTDSSSHDHGMLITYTLLPGEINGSTMVSSTTSDNTAATECCYPYRHAK